MCDLIGHVITYCTLYLKLRYG